MGVSARMDPSTGPMRSPISTNQTWNAAIFSAYFCLTRWYQQTTARHTLTRCGFVVFGSIAPQQNGCMGAYRVIDLEQFPVWISTDKALTHWQNLGFVLSFFSSSVTLLSFFLSLYRLVRFMAFQTVLVGTTAFTIIINSTKRSLLGQYIYIAILWSDLTVLCNILWH